MWEWSYELYIGVFARGCTWGVYMGVSDRWAEQAAPGSEKFTDAAPDFGTWPTEATGAAGMCLLRRVRGASKRSRQIGEALKSG
jgi:hypothetical protein